MRASVIVLGLVACKQSPPSTEAVVQAPTAVDARTIAIDGAVALVADAALTDAGAPADAAVDDMTAVANAPLLLYRGSHDSPMGRVSTLYRLERTDTRFTLAVEQTSADPMNQNDVRVTKERFEGTRKIGSGEVLTPAKGTGYWCKTSIIEVGALTETTGGRDSNADCKNGRLALMPPTKVASLQCWPLDEKGGSPRMQFALPPGLDHYGWSGVHCDGQSGHRWIPADGKIGRD